AAEKLRLALGLTHRRDVVVARHLPHRPPPERASKRDAGLRSSGASFSSLERTGLFRTLSDSVRAHSGDARPFRLRARALGGAGVREHADADSERFAVANRITAT